MKLERPLIFIDVEGTGTDPQIDRILELSLLDCDLIAPVKTYRSWTQRFNPGMLIPAKSTAVHGITDMMVASEPNFDVAIGKVVLSFLSCCDIAGYNLRRYDLPIIDEELRRVGLKLDLTGVNIIDVYGIFAKKESRTLSDAVRKYCDREHIAAHNSAADNQATRDVLCGQLAVYPDLDAMSVAGLAKFGELDENCYVDVARKLYRDKDGDLCYGFGKFRGMKVRDDMGYADWMLNRANFPGSTVDALQSEINRLYDEFNQGRWRASLNADDDIPF